MPVPQSSVPQSSVPQSPPRTRGRAARRRASDQASAPDPGLRVSDAERAEVADRLAQHYGDGRLDQAEFDKRLDQAMRAITQSDLSGLFTDLPGTDSAEPVAPQRQPRRHADPQPRRDPEPRRHPYRRVLGYALLIVITIAAWHALLRSVLTLLLVGFTPWLVIGFLVFLWLRYGPWQHRRPS